MTDQLLLVFDGTTASRFEDFHRNNGHVYRTLVRFAREWVNQTGRHKLGMKSLYERARWDLAIDTNDPDYRLNNDFTAFYARLIEAREPDLAGLFELRRSAADQWIDHYLMSRAS
jgi:hypothetical protein